MSIVGAFERPRDIVASVALLDVSITNFYTQTFGLMGIDEL
jgi:hypothetical protein